MLACWWLEGERKAVLFLQVLFSAAGLATGEDLTGIGMSVCILHSDLVIRKALACRGQWIVSLSFMGLPSHVASPLFITISLLTDACTGESYTMLLST